MKIYLFTTHRIMHGSCWPGDMNTMWLIWGVKYKVDVLFIIRQAGHLVDLE